MGYISRAKVNSIVSEIESEIKKTDHKISSMEDKLVDIYTKASRAQSYNGKKVAGSNHFNRSALNEDGHGPIQYSYQVFKIEGVSEVNSACKTLSRELEDSKIPLQGLLKNMGDVTEAMEIIAVYINLAEKTLSADDLKKGKFSFNDKLAHALAYMKYDFENGYDFLYSTPILEHGKVSFSIQTSDGWKTITKECDYYKFFNKDGINFIAPVGIIDMKGNFILFKNGKYNVAYTTDSEGKKIIMPEYDGYIKGNSEIRECDFANRELVRYIESYKAIMKHSEKYSDKFNQYATKNLDQVVFISNHADHDSYAHVSASKNSQMVIYGDSIARYGDIDPVQDTYTHELGHVFSSNYGKTKKYSETLEWTYVQKNVIDKVESNSSSQPIREYAQTHETESEYFDEGFAEMCAEYYGSGRKNGGLYNPNDLKEVDFETPLGAKTNLYEIMDKVLN